MIEVGIANTLTVDTIHNEYRERESLWFELCGSSMEGCDVVRMELARDVAVERKLS